MRRQLRATGGITNARQGYGIGSWVKERIRKIIPNELASVASKAAPFVAMIPGGAPYAAAMRGIGRFDQRGSMSDAIKQGALAYGFGKYAAPTIREGASNLYRGMTTPNVVNPNEETFKAGQKILTKDKHKIYSKLGLNFSL